MFSLLVITGAAVLAWSVASEDAAAHPLRQGIGTGKWQSHHDSAADRDWQVQLNLGDDGVVGGRVLITGGRWPQVTLDGRVDGSDVYGVLLADDGVQVGTFEGLVAKAGASGTYRMKDGDEGNWSTGMGSERGRQVSQANEVPATPAPARPDAAEESVAVDMATQ